MSVAMNRDGGLLTSTREEMKMHMPANFLLPTFVLLPPTPDSLLACKWSCSAASTRTIKEGPSGLM